MRRWRRLALFGATVVPLLSLTHPPLVVRAAAPDPLLPAYEEALTVVTEELSYLVLLDWVEPPVPNEARTMPADIGLEPLDRPLMVEELRFLDGVRGPAALAELERLGQPVPADARLVLSRNLPVVDGGAPRVGLLPYLRAYDQLVVRWDELDRAESAGLPPGAAPSVSDATPIDAPARPLETATPDWLVPTAFGAAAVLLVGVALLMRWTRRRLTALDTAAANDDDVLDAGRMILTTSDLDAFGTAVAQQVRRLTNAPGGALVVDEGSWTAGSITLPPIELISRVLVTGATLHTQTATLSPVVLEGRIVAVMVAGTPDPVAESVLESFGPLVGAAFHSVRTRAQHEQLAFDDGLTGVGNRRRFDRDLCGLLGVDARAGGVSLAMVDVDHFKVFNDQHGHPAGDAMLRHVADVLRANVRECDLVYRYGGEEFALLLPGADITEATVVVERVRHAVAASTPPGGLPAVTVSAGVSATPHRDGSAMLRAADAALYAAKSGGRNRVVVSTGPPPLP